MLSRACLGLPSPARRTGAGGGAGRRLCAGAAGVGLWVRAAGVEGGDGVAVAGADDSDRWSVESRMGWVVRRSVER